MHCAAGTDRFTNPPLVHVRDANHNTMHVLASQLRQYDGQMPKPSSNSSASPGHSNDGGDGGGGGSGGGGRASAARMVSLKESEKVHVGQTWYYEAQAVQVVSIDRHKRTARIFPVISAGAGSAAAASAAADAASHGRRKYSVPVQRWGSTKASRTTFAVQLEELSKAPRGVGGVGSVGRGGAHGGVDGVSAELQMVAVTVASLYGKGGWVEIAHRSNYLTARSIM